MRSKSSFLHDNADYHQKCQEIILKNEVFPLGLKVKVVSWTAAGGA